MGAPQLRNNKFGRGEIGRDCQWSQLTVDPKEK
jgi:hypothetical protein